MSPTKYPFYIKLVAVLAILLIISFIISVGHSIIFPIYISFLLAILLNPLMLFFRRLKISKVFSILFSVVIALIILSVIISFFIYGLSSFAEDLPVVKSNLQKYIASIQTWLYQRFNISYKSQLNYVNKYTDELLDYIGSLAGNTLSSITDFLFNFVLIPIYVYMFLFYKELFIKFMEELFKSEHIERVTDILHETKSVVQNYVNGLILELSVVAVLNTIGLLIIGAQYALLLGAFSAILNLIPYVGALISGFIAVVITISYSSNLALIIGVMAVFVVVQFIDNNYLMPKILGSKVQINAMFSILAVIIGGALAGVSGMFLSIPSLAIMKVIFDRIDSLKPWGMLLGEPSIAVKRKKGKLK